MTENTENKEELGAAYLQEMYEVNGNPDDVSKVKKFIIALYLVGSSVYV